MHWVVRSATRDYAYIDMNGELHLVDKDSASLFLSSATARFFAKFLSMSGTKFKVYRVVRS